MEKTEEINKVLSPSKPRKKIIKIATLVVLYILAFFAIPFIVLLFYFSFVKYRNLVSIRNVQVESQINLSNKPTSAPTSTPIPTATPIPLPDKTVVHTIPFSSQAPYGDWNDPRQQDGCEEMSVIMAVKWAKGESLTKDEALSILLDISSFLENTYGEYHDSSTYDTNEWIVKDYFGFTNSIYKENITINDIKQELFRDNLVIVPTNGQALHNPNFTPPGPERHMLVITGYDAQRREFITNDPGTRSGASYHYNEEVLFDAIRDYETGYHMGFPEVSKTMIVIQKES